jgi:hypothetical protein
MQTIIFVNFFVYAIVMGVSIFVGLDLKKWYAWLIATYGFISGAMFGFLSGSNTLALQGGVIFALIVLYGGAMNHRHRQKYNKDAAESWLAQHGQDRRFSVLTNILRKLVDK